MMIQCSIRQNLMIMNKASKNNRGKEIAKQQKSLLPLI